MALLLRDLQACIAPTVEYSSDKVLDVAIEADVEDVVFHTPSSDREEEGSHAAPQQILVEVSDLTKMEDALAKIGVTGVRSFLYLPSSTVVVEDESLRAHNEALIEALEDLDEVDAVFHDME
jgi:transcriptional/translational regulatory protein YebC/TACO1